MSHRDSTSYYCVDCVHRILQRVNADRANLMVTPDLKLEFVHVPEGEFIMGSDPSIDQNSRGNETPQHKRNLPEFWIGKTEVTVRQFAVFVGATQYITTAEKSGKSEIERPSGKFTQILGADWAHPYGPDTSNAYALDSPVVHVSFVDCEAFCAWASFAGVCDIGMPGDAEWEKAARGTDGRLYPWGNEPPDEFRCNHAMKLRYRTAVSMYGQGVSPYGCYDMSGNVQEWTRGACSRYPISESTEYDFFHAWSIRTIRGGAFVDDAKDVRCASRYCTVGNSSHDTLGFRVVLRIATR